MRYFEIVGGCDKLVPAYPPGDRVGQDSGAVNGGCMSCCIRAAAGQRRNGAIKEMSHFALQQNEQKVLLKGQWHFRWHVCIGAAGKIWGLR
jgi:hypothetical protein